jgi:hypothetical protein
MGAILPHPNLLHFFAPTGNNCDKFKVLVWTTPELVALVRAYRQQLRQVRGGSPANRSAAGDRVAHRDGPS